MLKALRMSLECLLEAMLKIQAATCWELDVRGSELSNSTSSFSRSACAAAYLHGVQHCPAQVRKTHTAILANFLVACSEVSMDRSSTVQSSHRHPTCPVVLVGTNVGKGVPATSVMITGMPVCSRMPLVRVAAVSCLAGSSTPLCSFLVQERNYSPCSLPVAHLDGCILPQQQPCSNNTIKAIHQCY